MTQKQISVPVTLVRIAVVLFGLLFAVLLTWFWADAHIILEEEPESNTISVEAFMGGYEAIVEELNTPLPETVPEVVPDIVFSLDSAGSVFFTSDCELEMTSPGGGRIY